MRWQSRIATVGMFSIFFYLPFTAVAVEVCCRCQKGSLRVCVQSITDNATADCADVLRQSPTLRALQTSETALFDGFNCSVTPLTSTQCRSVSAGGVCGGEGFSSQPMATPGTLVAALRSPTPAPTTPTGGTGSASKTIPSSEKRAFNPITPELGVPIPGMTLSPPTQANQKVTIPFLAQYIAGGYRYALRIALVAAIIMVVYGGFRYLIGSAFSDVTRGKEIVKDAIMGLLILLGGYLILQTVNPNVLQLQNIELQSIETEIIELAQMTTEVDTRAGSVEGSDGGGATYTSPGNQNCPIPDLPPGCGSPGLQSCADMPKSRDQRTRAFRERLRQHLRSSDPRQRILEAAEAAVNCGIHFGSCGSTAGGIITSAGLRIGSGPFHSQEMTRLGNRLSCQTARDCNRIAPQQFPPPGPDCLNNPTEATSRVREFAQANQDATADLLQPGDWFQTYNGNNSCGGGHSMIFMGWESPGSSYARMVNGAWGHLASRGRICLRTRCRNFSPIYRIKRAAEVR